MVSKTLALNNLLAPLHLASGERNSPKASVWNFFCFPSSYIIILMIGISFLPSTNAQKEKKKNPTISNKEPFTPLSPKNERPQTSLTDHNHHLLLKAYRANLPLLLPSHTTKISPSEL